MFWQLVDFDLRCNAIHMCYDSPMILFLTTDLILWQLVDTTVEIANKVGAAEIIGRVVDDLKDEAEQYRKMVMETIEKVGPLCQTRSRLLKTYAKFNIPWILR